MRISPALSTEPIVRPPHEPARSAFQVPQIVLPRDAYGEHRRAWADAGDPRRGSLAAEGSDPVDLGGVPDLTQRDDAEPGIARSGLSQALDPPAPLRSEP